MINKEIEIEFDNLYKSLMHQSRTLLLFNSIIPVSKSQDYYNNSLGQQFSHKLILELMSLFQVDFACSARRFIELLIKKQKKNSINFHYQFDKINRLRYFIKISDDKNLSIDNSDFYGDLLSLKKHLEYYYIHYRATDFNKNINNLSQHNIAISYNSFANKLLNFNAHAFVSNEKIENNGNAYISIDFLEIEKLLFANESNNNKHKIFQNEINIELRTYFIK